MNMMDVRGITIDDWKKLRRKLYFVNKTVGMVVSCGIEVGMTPLEICKAKINNLEEHQGKDFIFWTLYLDEGCKGIRVGKKRDRTEERKRTVVLNSRLGEEIYYYTIDRRGRDKYIFQSDKHKQKDGLSIATIERWYFENRLPFKPHAIKDKRLGARHLHKYLVESVCAESENVNYVERQIELHLGHIVTRTGFGSVNYGNIPNIPLIARMVEETFVRN